MKSSNHKWEEKYNNKHCTERKITIATSYEMNQVKKHADILTATFTKWMLLTSYLTKTL